MPDPIERHFSYGQLSQLQPAYSQNRAGSYMPDLTFCIWFGSVLQKKAQITLCKTGPALIWMAWWGFGQMHLVHQQACVQESSGLVLAEHNQPATSFTLSDSVALYRWLRYIVQNQPGSNNVWLTASCFGQADPVCKQAGVQESLGPLLANASKPNRTIFKSDPACLVYWEETC